MYCGNTSATRSSGDRSLWTRVIPKVAVGKVVIEAVEVLMPMYLAGPVA